MSVLAVANQKGGVGKTATTINLGAALAEEGSRVLLIDFDPQTSLTLGLGVRGASATITDVLRDNLPLAEAVLRTKNVDLLAGHLSLAEYEFTVFTRPGRENVLKERLGAARRWDYVLIDCPPSLGLLTVIALVACEAVLIPVACDYLSFKGMERLLDTIEGVRARLNPKLQIAGILPTMFDARTVHSRDILQELWASYPDLVFDTVIPKRIAVADSSVAGEAVVTYQPRSEIAGIYRDLAKEIHASAT